MRKIAAIGVGLAVATFGLSAMAEEPAPAPAAAAPAAGSGLGAAGQISIQSDFELSFTSSKSKPPQGDAGPSLTTIRLAPALDYFVAPNISVGGQLSYTSQSQGDAKRSAIGVGPRVGYALSLGEKLGFWPRLAFEYQSTSQDVTIGNTTRSASGSTMTVSVFAPILFQPANHFFIGLGPVFQTDISSKVEGEDAAKTTTFGAVSTVGGYF